MKATQEQAVVETSVFWDIKTYPVPRGLDARRVGWCINRYLRRLGYSGTLTIIAVGLLTDVPEGLLRKLSSTGIFLNHVPLGSIGILRSMDAWKQTYPAPANMMLISSDESILPRIRHSSGYNIRPLLPNYSASAWRRFLLRDSREWTGTAESPAYWLCSVCNDGVCSGFENFTTHLYSEEHADKAIRVDEESVGSTWVLWDIDRCPVPPDCDPRRVRPLIKQYLEDFGYSGSFSITATGLLTDVPRDVLRALMSTEIDFHHISFNSDDILSVMFEWSLMNPCPANTLLISQYSHVSVQVVAGVQGFGCNVIELFSYYSPYSESLWKTFLLEGSVTLGEEDKCSETGEHASWLCSKHHYISGQGFDNFITHVSSPDHKPRPIKFVTDTTVFWDIKEFPMLPNCDARHVSLSFKLFSEDSGYSGSCTINAIGLLTDVPLDVLRAVSATGIILNHATSDSAALICHWASLNSPPANVIVICPYSETLAKAVGDLREKGYTIILPFQYESRNSENEWENFLMEFTATFEEEERHKGSETGEHASWVCSVCHHISGQGFDNFTTHLSQEHKQEEIPPMLTQPVEAEVGMYSFSFPLSETVSVVVEAGVEATNLKKSGSASQRLKEKQKKELMKETKEASKAGDEALVRTLRKTVSYKDVKRMSKSQKTKTEEKLAKAGDEALCSLRKTVSDQDVSKYLQTTLVDRSLVFAETSECQEKNDFMKKFKEVAKAEALSHFVC